MKAKVMQKGALQKINSTEMVPLGHHLMVRKTALKKENQSIFASGDQFFICCVLSDTSIPLNGMTMVQDV